MTERNIPREKKEFEQILVDLRRVARMVGGGRRFRFRATVVIGDRKGRVGEGIARGADVALAIEKAVDQAKKHLIKVPLYKGTIPHEVRTKYGAAKVILKPASPGTGLIAGGSVRAVLELAGLRNVLAKMVGNTNKTNNIRATLNALKRFEITQKIFSYRSKDMWGGKKKSIKTRPKKEQEPKNSNIKSRP